MLSTSSNKTATAFTLIELAIVIVITGLVAGGVLVGTALIKVAEIREVISTVSTFSTAATTFHSKYDGIAGDLEATRAAKFNFIARGGTSGHGDGNGALESCITGGQALGCETALFWRDLSQALLIEMSLTTATDAYADGTAPGFHVSDYLPPLAKRDGLNIFAYTASSRNSFFMASFPNVDVSGVLTSADALSALEAKNIDDKIDNSIPGSGNIRAMSGLSTPDAGGVASSTECVVSTTTPPSYNASDAFGDEITCQLLLMNTF